MASRTTTGWANGVKAVLTLAVVIAPDLAIMHVMGWESLPELSLACAWAVFSSLMVVFIPHRHRRHEFSRVALVIALFGWVLCGMLLLASDWEARTVMAVLLVLPGLNFLLLEHLGLTPSPAIDGPL